MDTLPVDTLPPAWRLAPGATSRLVAAALALTALSACTPLVPYAEVRARSSEDLLAIGHDSVYLVDEGEGDADSSPILLLHGFGASSYSWRQVVPELADDRRVLALDLHGFGLSERPEDLAAYTATGQIAMVLAVLDTLAIDRVHLVGHSYGGALATVLTGRHPERVESLTLVAAAAPEYLSSRRRSVRASQAVAPLVVRGLMLHRERIRDNLEDSVADPSIISPEIVDAYYDRLRIEGVVRAYRGLTRPLDHPEPEVDLSRLEPPVLLVWGERDPLIPVETARKAAAPIPESRFVTLPAVGHLPMEEAPDALSEAIASFVAEVEARDEQPRERRASGSREATATGG